jgi:hypothetical protein
LPHQSYPFDKDDAGSETYDAANFSK